MDRSSSLPESTRRGRNSMTVCLQYTAHKEPPLYSAVSAVASTSFSPSLDSIGRQPAADEVVDSLLARPGQPSLPERPDLRRLGDADRQEIRLDQQDRPARLSAGHEIGHSSLSVGDVVQHGAGRHQIKVSRPDWPRQDVGLAILEPGYVRVEQGQVEIHRHCPPAGRDPPGQPSRYGAVTAANFERPSSRSGAEPLKVAAVHRIEQPRHEGQSLALAFLVMIKDVLWHAVPGRLRQTIPGQQILRLPAVSAYARIGMGSRVHKLVCAASRAGRR